MNRRCIAVILALCLGCLGCAIKTPEQVLDRSAKALMGSNSPDNLNAIIMTGNVDLPQGMKGQFEILAKEGGKIYNRVTLEGLNMEVVQACDGTDCYELNPMLGPRLLEGGEKAQLLSTANFKRDMDWKHYYKSFELVGTEMVDGHETYKLKLTSIDGLDMVNYYDAKTFLVVRSDTTVDGQMGRIEAKSFIHDYRDVEGFMLPQEIVTKALSHEMVMRIAEYQINPDIPDSKFLLPEDLKP